MWAQSWDVHCRVGLMKPQLSAGRLEKGSLREPKDCKRMRSLGNWLLKVAYGLMSWLPSCTCMSLIPKQHTETSRTELWDRPPLTPKLDTAWDSYETHSVWPQRVCKLNCNWKYNPQKADHNLKCEPNWVSYWLKQTHQHSQWDLNKIQSAIIFQVSRIQSGTTQFKKELEKLNSHRKRQWTDGDAKITQILKLSEK